MLSKSDSERFSVHHCVKTTLNYNAPYVRRYCIFGYIVSHSGCTAPVIVLILQSGGGIAALPHPVDQQVRPDAELRIRRSQASSMCTVLEDMHLCGDASR
jgi:hypothetical protein